MIAAKLPSREESMERRLAAILATDVVGYSRLIRADEEGTIAALKAFRAKPALRGEAVKSET